MSDNGLVAVKLPGGTHSAELKYGLSPIGRIARSISYLAWAVWLGAAILVAIQRRKTHDRRPPLGGASYVSSA